MKHKILYAAIGVLALFIITNPSVTAFKTYRGKSSYEGLYRPTNLFVASVYKDGGNKYIGMVGNFWRVEKSEPQQITVVLPEIDSMKTDTAKSSLPKALKLYNNLLKSGLTQQQIGTPDNFIRVLEDSTKAMKLYANLKRVGFTEVNLGTPKEFKQAFCN